MFKESSWSIFVLEFVFSASKWFYCFMIVVLLLYLFENHQYAITHAGVVKLVKPDFTKRPLSSNLELELSLKDLVD